MKNTKKQNYFLKVFKHYLKEKDFKCIVWLPLIQMYVPCYNIPTNENLGLSEIVHIKK